MKMAADTESAATPSTLREAMSRHAAGVVVVTVGGSQPHGMTANSFVSVSLEPELVLVCLGATSRIIAPLERERSFAISLLDARHQSVAEHFASRERGQGWLQFDGYSTARLGRAPLIDEATAWIECDLKKLWPEGDHLIALGLVRHCTLPQKTGPSAGLTYFDSSYRAALSPKEEVNGEQRMRSIDLAS